MRGVRLNEDGIEDEDFSVAHSTRTGDIYYRFNYFIDVFILGMQQEGDLRQIRHGVFATVIFVQIILLASVTLDRRNGTALDDVQGGNFVQ